MASVASSRSPTGQVEDAAQGRLAAGAEQDRPAEHRERAQLAHQLEVVLGGLAEPEPRVDDQVVPADAEREGALDGALQIGDQLGEEASCSAPPPGCA